MLLPGLLAPTRRSGDPMGNSFLWQRGYGHSSPASPRNPRRRALVRCFLPWGRSSESASSSLSESTLGNSRLLLSSPSVGVGNACVDVGVASAIGLSFAAANEASQKCDRIMSHFGRTFCRRGLEEGVNGLLPSLLIGFGSPLILLSMRTICSDGSATALGPDGHPRA